MLSLFHRRGSQFRLWSFQLPRLSSPPHTPRTPPRPCGLHSLHVPSSLPGLSSRVPPDACRRARCYRVPAPQPYRSQGAGRRGGRAKPVPRSPPRAPTLEAAAPLRSRGGRRRLCRDDRRSARRDRAPAGRPTRWAGRKAGPRTEPTPRPGAQFAATPPRARSEAQRSARREEFSQNGTAGKTLEIPIPGAVSQRPEEGSRGNGPGAGRGRERSGRGVGTRAASGQRGAGWPERGRSREVQGGKGRGLKKGASGARGRGARRSRHSPGGRGGWGWSRAAGPPSPAWSLKGGRLECAE